ncbi:hypothetical protein BV455_02966 [Parageobacillus caldoxylosilyticus]|uniref:hypothetical protein n=1 Tax=Saccharococcus caldoxylosilyticus TaxID=81408 RepID=UPI001C4E2AE2|nr:hypothetical protein [Parageobacillus caldoxylosilyticus]QXJ39600.1 hypothetical protein BV455_02966 [Parageobacillus caldoxylosilyticus]
MPFDQNNLPEWNATGVEPPQSKKDNGWGATEKPPADWFNWFFNKTYNALKSLFTNAQHKEEKGQPNGYASLDENAKVPASQLPIATTTSPGAISAADKAKLDSIATGAEVNQNAFSTIRVGNTNIDADSETDTLELVAGNAVTITPDAANDRVTIAVPNATSSTPGAMSATDKAKLDGIQSGAEPNQNAFSNVKVGTTTIAADSKTDTLELVAGQNIVLTPDAANDKVTIDVTGVAPSSHTHPFSDITNKPTTVDGYGITDAVKTSDVVTSPAPNKILKLDANGKLPTSITGNADGNAATASKLQTARTISLTGDATGSTSFDGSANASIAVTLANSGVTPGTYPKVTVDAKGRVTDGQSLSPSDIPNLDWSKITSGKPTTLSGYGITDGVQNAGGAPSIQAGADASKPSAGVAGRLYVATDTKKIYRDNGTSWDVIGTINWADIAGKPTTLSGYGITDGVPIGRKINVGAGLTGGGDLSADRTISVSFGGNGSATTVARSDHNHDGTYVKKAGDTMTGALTISSASNPGLELRSTGGGTPFIDFSNDGSTDYDARIILNGDDVLDIQGVGSSGLKVNGQTVWNAGNDGPGSGLDADTVDGKHFSDIQADAQAKANQAETNAKNYLDNQKGQPNGVATLDANGKVPASQLNISTSADAISITDSGGYYTSSEVEGALQEIGQVLNAMRGDLITSVNNVLNM